MFGDFIILCYWAISFVILIIFSRIKIGRRIVSTVIVINCSITVGWSRDVLTSVGITFKLMIYIYRLIDTIRQQEYIYSFVCTKFTENLL